jgi:hypothetical protein
MAHELLHALGLKHEPRMHCSGGLPANLATTLSQCSAATYDSTVSVMSSAESGNHPSAYHKWKLGFLTDANLTLVDARSMTAGQSFSKTIVQSTQTQNSSARQILAVQLDDAENMLIFQYRIAAGFDNKTLRSSDWITFPAGVYVSLRPGQDWANEDLYLLYSENNQRSPILLTQGSTFSDSARKLSFQVTSLTGGMATIKVTRS